MKIEASYKQIKENYLSVLDCFKEELKNSNSSNRFAPIEKFKFYYDIEKNITDNNHCYMLFITAEYQDVILKSGFVESSNIHKLILDGIITEAKLKEEHTSNPVSIDEIEHVLTWLIGDYLEIYYQTFAKDTDKDGNNLFEKFCRGIRGICHKFELNPDTYDKFRILLRTKE